MGDETKDTSPNQGDEPSDSKKSATDQEVALPGVEKPSMTPTEEGAIAAGSPSAPKKVEPEGEGKPAPPRAAPPKAAPAAGHKPAPPPKKGPTITFDITGDPLIDGIRQRFGDAITEAVATLGQQNIRVKKDSLVELCRFLHDDEE